jgi:hypothetical protein
MSGLLPLRGNGSSSIGMEEAQVAAMIQIYDHIDAALARQAAFWDGIDQAVALHMGARYRRTVLERPPKGCIYPGVRGGVLDMPWDRFPSMYVMADNATPKAESAAFDQPLRAYATSLYVEGFVRSDLFNYEDKSERIFHEGAVDRRAKRTINAIIECIETDPSLGGAVQELPAPSAWTLDSYAVRLNAQETTPGVLPAVLGGRW